MRTNTVETYDHPKPRPCPHVRKDGTATHYCSNGKCRACARKSSRDWYARKGWIGKRLRTPTNLKSRVKISADQLAIGL